MARLVLLGPAREAAGRARDDVPGDTVGDVLAAATERYGRPFTDVLAISGIWVNGVTATSDSAVGPYDEVAVVPPVSGG